MLTSPTFVDGDSLPYEFYTQLRNTENLPVAMQFWAGYVARELLILGVFFRAAGIMLQVPGACDYRPLFYDDHDDRLGAQSEDPSRRVESADRGTLLNVLAHCLAGVGAQELMKQVPGGADYASDEPRLSDEWKAYIKAQLRFECGLLNIIAECLDELIVRPGIAEIDERAKNPWWQQWWARM